MLILCQPPMKETSAAGSFGNSSAVWWPESILCGTEGPSEPRGGYGSRRHEVDVV